MAGLGAPGGPSTRARGCDTALPARPHVQSTLEQTSRPGVPPVNGAGGQLGRVRGRGAAGSTANS